MPSSRRIEKLNTLFAEEIARITDREIEFPDGVLVTLTRVSVSSDGAFADAFFSVLGRGKEKEALEILQKNAYAVQRFIVKAVRMRPVPKIRFFIDRAEARREGVERSLALLKQKNLL